jgi:tetratricopeptide (TPR) repeat protein
MKTRSSKSLRLVGACILGAGFLAVVTPRLSAQEDEGGGELPPEAKQEIAYAAGLQDLGFPEFSDIIIGRLVTKWGTKFPDILLQVEVMKVRGLLQLGKFDAVKAIIAKKPDQKSEVVWALKLALADGYYAWGKYTDAQAIYNGFFAAYPKGPGKKLKPFYVNAAYKYAQMLILMGENKGAIKAYENLLGAKPVKNVRRQAQGEMAELMVKMCEEDEKVRKAYLPKVEKLCNEILWIQDVWFGKAIVYLAHVKKMSGDIKGAKSLIDDYRPQLKDIDKALMEEAERSGEDLTRLSPMAECRYLVAVMMQEESDKLFKAGKKAEAVDLLVGEKNPKTGKRGAGAYHHFLNVFIRYPTTKWAGDAGRRARAVEEFLVDNFGATIDSKVTRAQWEKVEKFQFQEARSLYNQNRFKDAIVAYVTVLNLFPERPTSVLALGELARCYIETKQTVHSEMVVRHIAERFKVREELMQKAGDVLLRLAVACGEEYKLPVLRNDIHKLFFSQLTEHPRAANLLYDFGSDAFDEEDYPKSRGYFERIIADFPKSLVYFPAHNKLAQCYGAEGNRTNEIATLEAYVEVLGKEAVPGHAYVNAKYRRALALRELGADENLIMSAAACAELIALIKKGEQKYSRNEDERENNNKALEGCYFFKALSQSMLAEPADKVEAFKRQAISDFESLVKQFPKSQFAPVSLSRVGVLWTLLDNPEEAEKALRRLQDQYPDSEEAKNALFVLGRSLLELGKRKDAVKVFKEMFSGAGKYSSGQILTAGKELLKAKEYTIALEAFERVLTMVQPDDRPRREPALLGKGKVLIELKKYEEGSKTLDMLLNDKVNGYPNSGFTVEASVYLSRGYREMAVKEQNEVARFDLFNLAVRAMQKVHKHDPTPARRVEVAVAVGRITVLKAKAETDHNKTPAGKDLALKYKNDAIAAYQTVIMLVDPTEEGVGPHMQDAYGDCLPLMLETATAENKRYANVIEDCGNYLKLYPEGKYVIDIGRWKTRASTKLAQLGSGVPETPAPAPGANKPEEK